MATFSAAASFLVSCFQDARRDDGSDYIRNTPDSPDWVRELIYTCHDGESPNDARYRLIKDAAVAISKQQFSDADDARDAISDLSVDLLPIYIAEILHWFAGNTTRLGDCDTYLADTGASVASTYDLLSVGYQLAAENVLGLIVDSLEENRLSIFNPDTDCRLLISDIQGIYIPQLYCQQLTEDDAVEYGVQWSDVVCCQSGPEQDWYWESWQAILESAEIIEPATLMEDESVWRLHQNGDLWAIRADVDLPEGF